MGQRARGGRRSLMAMVCGLALLGCGGSDNSSSDDFPGDDSPAAAAPAPSELDTFGFPDWYQSVTLGTPVDAMSNDVRVDKFVIDPNQLVFGVGIKELATFSANATERNITIDSKSAARKSAWSAGGSVSVSVLSLSAEASFSYAKESNSSNTGFELTAYAYTPGLLSLNIGQLTDDAPIEVVDEEGAKSFQNRPQILKYISPQFRVALDKIADAHRTGNVGEIILAYTDFREKWGSHMVTKIRMMDYAEGKLTSSSDSASSASNWKASMSVGTSFFGAGVGAAADASKSWGEASSESKVEIASRSTPGSSHEGFVNGWMEKLAGKAIANIGAELAVPNVQSKAPTAPKKEASKDPKTVPPLKDFAPKNLEEAMTKEYAAVLKKKHFSNKDSEGKADIEFLKEAQTSMKMFAQDQLKATKLIAPDDSRVDAPAGKKREHAVEAGSGFGENLRVSSASVPRELEVGSAAQSLSGVYGSFYVRGYEVTPYKELFPKYFVELPIISPENAYAAKALGAVMTRMAFAQYLRFLTRFDAWVLEGAGYSKDSVEFAAATWADKTSEMLRRVGADMVADAEVGGQVIDETYARRLSQELDAQVEQAGAIIKLGKSFKWVLDAPGGYQVLFFANNFGDSAVSCYYPRGHFGVTANRTCPTDKNVHAGTILKSAAQIFPIVLDESKISWATLDADGHPHLLVSGRALAWFEGSAGAARGQRTTFSFPQPRERDGLLWLSDGPHPHQFKVPSGGSTFGVLQPIGFDALSRVSMPVAMYTNLDFPALADAVR